MICQNHNFCSLLACMHYCRLYRDLNGLATYANNTVLGTPNQISVIFVDCHNADGHRHFVLFPYNCVCFTFVVILHTLNRSCLTPERNLETLHLFLNLLSVLQLPILGRKFRWASSLANVMCRLQRMSTIFFWWVIFYYNIIDGSVL